MGRKIIFRAHLVARCAPRVGLVHERRHSIYGTTWSDSARMLWVHMRQSKPSLWSGVFPRHLLYIPPNDAPHFRKRRAHRPQSRGRPLRSVPLPLLLISHSPSISSGLYVSLFAGCVSVLYQKRRRRGGGNYRLILVSTTLFVLITWVRPSLSTSLSFHSFPSAASGPRCRSSVSRLPWE
jgi:hypothetical protein